MEAIGVSEGGIRAMSGKAQALAVKVAGACVPAAHILKQQMLSLGGDAAVARDVLTHKIDSSDVILMGTHAQMRDLAGRLAYQPFDLPELGKEIEALVASLEPRRRTVFRARGHSLDLGARVHVLGILNVTPDSFSNGGLYHRPSAAFDYALEMIDDGADMIDIGGQSSRPGSSPILEEEELKRIIPLVERLHEEWNGPISIDTYRSHVAEEALKAGASIVNDITALSAEPRIAEVTSRFDAGCVLMHMQGAPDTMQQDPRYDDLMGEITLFLKAAIERATAAGIGEDQIVVDPGLGFGKTTAHNLAIVRRLPELVVLGRPVLIGPSRKGFIGRVLDLPIEDRLEGTLATAAYAVAQGARILRVHDVKPVVRAVRMVEACLASPA